MDNTLLFITSDNADDVQGSAGALRGCKQLTYEGGQRVPMIIYGQNIISKPRTTSAMATNLNIFPTLIDLLDLDLPDDRIIDGETMLPMMVGDTDVLQDYVYYNATANGNFVGVGDQEYKYHESAIGIHLSLFGIWDPLQLCLRN